MADYQLTAPTLLAGYRPSRPRLGDFTLRFDPPQLFAQPHWFGLPAMNDVAPLLGPSFAALDEDLQRMLGSWSGQVPPPPAPPPLQPLLGLLSEDLKRKIAQAINDALSPPLIAPGWTNVANDDPATYGHRNADGTPRYFPPEKVVPGTTLPAAKLVWKGLDLIGVGRRFKYSSVRDIDVGIIFDKDAALTGRFGLMFSGASLEVPFTAPGGVAGKLLLVGGRDQTGGAAGAITLSFALP